MELLVWLYGTGGGLELTTLDVVIWVRIKGSVHAKSGNRNNVVAVVIDLPARAEAGSVYGCITTESSTLWRRRLRRLGGRGRAEGQADGLDGGGGNMSDGEDEAEKDGGELHI